MISKKQSIRCLYKENRKVDMQNNTIPTVIIGLIFAGLVGFGLYLYQMQVNNEARYQCAQSSRYFTRSAEGVEVWYPVADMYNKCLAEKGL